MKDFSEAKITAVISDLHLCEEEPVNPQFPLWKKYKTRQFFFDKEFCDFLYYLNGLSQGETVELVLNGDIFDFDSVTGLPDSPPYRLSWLERRSGLHPEERRSVFKMDQILSAHDEWVSGLSWFIKQGHRAVFVIGNHDLELHWPEVQKAIDQALDLPDEFKSNVRFCEWFYISNKDTMIEHGNQYDPYCMTQDPVNPLLQRFNRIEVRVPFGNLATRYLINAMGFFNPHVESNFIMSAKEYVVFFFKYMVRAQPLLMFSWLWGATVVLVRSFADRLLPSIKDPLTIEDRIEVIAKKSNATPRMVRELKDLFVAPAASYPILLARELWLDRAFLMALVFVAIFQLFLFIQTVYDISFFWFFIPLLAFFPFFMFYSKSIQSDVHSYKEPKEDILATASVITGVNRIVFGHTHVVRHELIGPVEHLNCGTWSPAFLDVECEKPIGRKTFVLIQPENGTREAQLLQFKEGQALDVFSARTKVKSS